MIHKLMLGLLMTLTLQMSAGSIQENDFQIKESKNIVRSSKSSHSISKYLPSKEYIPAMIFGLIAVIRNTTDLQVPVFKDLYHYSFSLTIGSATMAYCIKHDKKGYIPAVVLTYFLPRCIALFDQKHLPKRVTTINQYSSSLALTSLLAGHAYEVYKKEQAEKKSEKNMVFES